MKLSKDLREFIELLNFQKVKYLVLGGYALAWHGHPRFTGDIDFFVERSPSNAEALIKVLHAFGFASLGIQSADFQKPETVIQLGRPPNRIDLLTSASGIEFTDAWQAKIETTIDGLPVFLISKKLLVQNKRAVSRPQDLADIQRLESPGN